MVEISVFQKRNFLSTYMYPSWQIMNYQAFSCNCFGKFKEKLLFINHIYPETIGQFMLRKI